jgi:hypothetical protein
MKVVFNVWVVCLLCSLASVGQGIGPSAQTPHIDDQVEPRQQDEAPAPAEQDPAQCPDAFDHRTGARDKTDQTLFSEDGWS